MIEIINELFNVEQDENFGQSVFSILKKMIDFESGYIFFTNPKRLEYSFNPKEDTNEVSLKEDLMYKNTVFGEIIITGEEFSIEDKKFFKACAVVISNLLKDIEISKIITMQSSALQDAYLQVKKSENLKTKFLSHVSHELRTPLNSILGYSDLLSGEFTGRLNEKQKEYVDDIKAAGLHLMDMINEVLDMSKIEAGVLKLNLSEFDVVQAVQEVLNIVNPLILEKNINLVNNVKSTVIKADYQKFQQILFNLLSNAIKYTKDEIIINSVQKDKNFQISVKDNGVGIAKENHEKIFEKFEQLDETHQYSTGLGLSIVKELVKLHGGTIELKSLQGKGAEFIVKFDINF